MTVTVRKIIEIDEEKCDGCGKCVDACAEGAIEIRDRKAKIVRDLFCDGFGACLGECPRGALSIVEREAEAFDEEAAKRHVEDAGRPSSGCLSATPLVLHPAPAVPSSDGGSELSNWPIQMGLLPPSAPYLKDARLLLAGDCTAFAFAAMHPQFIRGRITVIGCPKLDDNEGFIERLSEVLTKNRLQELTVVHMDVPCCGQLGRLVREAKKRSGSDVRVESHTIHRNGSMVKDKA